MNYNFFLEIRVFEKDFVRRIFGSTRGEVTGGRIKQHNREHNNFYYSVNVISIIRSRKIWETISTDGCGINLMQNFICNEEV
jgi:hypothetical protein